MDNPSDSPESHQCPSRWTTVLTWVALECASSLVGTAVQTVIDVLSTMC